MQTFDDLVAIVARLRAPDGCPWDREQTHLSIAPNITEEAAEAVDAIERGNLEGLVEELGDLLLQVLLQAQIAEEAGEFGLAEVVEAISAKLVRRHPHVFGASAALAHIDLPEESRQALQEKIDKAQGPEAVLELWDSIKLVERQGRDSREKAGLLDSVPAALPALMQAQDISRKAISAGFDWGSAEEVWQQAVLEAEEFKAEERGSEAAHDEFGDILFTLVNVAIKEGIDAEGALRSTIRRFRGRWAIMEKHSPAASGGLAALGSDELEALWQQAKLELGQASQGTD